PLAALLHEAHRLAHLLHANEIAVVAIAVLADRDVELKLAVAFVRLALAQVPRGTRAPHHDAGEALRPGIVELDHADIDIALLENAVVGEQALDVVADLEKRIAEGVDVGDQFRRQVLVDAARAEISGADAGGARALR